MQTTATIPRASPTVLLHALLAVGTACTLNGCANYSQVISEDADGSYSLTATGISYTMSMPALTAASHDKAASWCAAQDADLQLRQQTRGWKPMQVELNFRCLPKQAGQPDQSALLPSSLPTSLPIIK
ncbi:hypothetical protein PMI16_03587 [Herbaspirillum sp. CF444]|uniref:hypothetical protein n=1 Tax=Herbaspirillum sp. CF444 TaxID=1144319 RepID=UPI0002723A64|nr:hypothetical protein [Herbaspirillum sp. CF444]EJL85079.1 hypothetical protein PMI16_03587 [Herbaspirillum sp. CF444]